MSVHDDRAVCAKCGKARHEALLLCREDRNGVHAFRYELAPVPHTTHVQRVVLVDHRPGGGGRVFDASSCRVSLQLQDDGRTLKIFVDGAE